jgi:hypothetical protein
VSCAAPSAAPVRAVSARSERTPAGRRLPAMAHFRTACRRRSRSTGFTCPRPAMPGLTRANAP